MKGYLSSGAGNPIPLSFSRLLLLLSAFHASNAIADDDIGLIDSVSFAGGYGKTLSKLEDLNQGVSGINKPEENGLGLNFALTFSPELMDSTRVYLDFQALIQDDRKFSIPGIGFRYDFKPQTEAFQPYSKLGVTYVYMEWDKTPVSNVIASSNSGQSLGIAGQVGFDYYLTENFALGAVARIDSYDIGSVLVAGNSATTINETLSLSAMLSMTYRFNKPQRVETVAEVEVYRDGDQDGVYDRYDLCPDTLHRVPVDADGCPLDAFEMSLNYEYAKYQIAGITTEREFPFAEFMQKNGTFKVLIIGHTDNVGSEQFNQELSEKRAEEAKQFLLDKGIPESRITTVGKGERGALYSNESAESRALNRHVTVTFYNAKRIEP
ncbi:OmpA family protein [Vibrio sp. HN007]|uniref:OmpA family protein n=1 Tax=Vibrio iocasae TaxID=3098914 RepID=UPI0035D4A6B4